MSDKYIERNTTPGTSKALGIRFATVLQSHCKIKDISLNELSNMIGMERKYLSQCLMVSRIPPDALLLRIGTVLKADMDEFMSGYDAVSEYDVKAYYESIGKTYDDNGWNESTEMSLQDSEWSKTAKQLEHRKILEVGVPYDSLVMTDNKMKGRYLKKHSVVLYAKDGIFEEDGGLYCCIINNKRYIRLIYKLPSEIFAVSTAGCFNYEAPQYYNKDDIIIVGKVLFHYYDHDHDKGSEND